MLGTWEDEPSSWRRVARAGTANLALAGLGRITVIAVSCLLRRTVQHLLRMWREGFMTWTATRQPTGAEKRSVEGAKGRRDSPQLTLGGDE